MYGLELAFAICAAIGGVLFLVRLVLQLLGIRNDITAGLASDNLDLPNGAVGIKVLSFPGISAFLTLFGITGFALYHSAQAGAPASLGGAAVAGLIAAWLVAFLLRSLHRKRSTGDFNPAHSIGQSGTVYLTIPAGGTGKVSVTLNTRLCVFDAVAYDKLEIANGETVQVAELMGQNVLIVKRTTSNPAK